MQEGKRSKRERNHPIKYIHTHDDDMVCSKTNGIICMYGDGMI